VRYFFENGDFSDEYDLVIARTGDIYKATWLIRGIPKRQNDGLLRLCGQCRVACRLRYRAPAPGSALSANQQPDLLNPAGQHRRRRFGFARSSALLNAMAEDLLVDMPDPTSLPQPGASIASLSSSR